MLRLAKVWPNVWPLHGAQTSQAWKARAHERQEQEQESRRSHKGKSAGSFMLPAGLQGCRAARCLQNYTTTTLQLELQCLRERLKRPAGVRRPRTSQQLRRVLSLGFECLITLPISGFRVDFSNQRCHVSCRKNRHLLEPPCNPFYEQQHTRGNATVVVNGLQVRCAEVRWPRAWVWLLLV